MTMFTIHFLKGRKHLLILLTACLFTAKLPGQTAWYTTRNAHSHNDYEQKTPYWLAYEHEFGSIEADIFLGDYDLIVAHDTSELKLNRSFKTLYLENMDSCVRKNSGYPYPDSSRNLQLLIDIKTDSAKTLQKIIDLLKLYPALTRNRHIFFVITGNMPDARTFGEFPDFILFDGVLSRNYTRGQLSKIRMLSDDFRQYSKWQGEGQIPAEDVRKIRSRIENAHREGKQVRLWGAPDSGNAWTRLIQLQVDFINTDHIFDLAEFLQRNRFRYSSPENGIISFK